MSEFAGRPNRIPWPPILYAAAIALSVALAVWVRLPWFGAPLADILFAAGLVTMAVAIGLDFYAMKTLHAGKTTIMPNKGSAHFVHNGPYAFTRNPIYLGNTLLMIGGGLVSGAAWFFPLAFFAAFLTQKLAIEREEKHLAERFGKPYRDYCKKVRRWI